MTLQLVTACESEPARELSEEADTTVLPESKAKRSGSVDLEVEVVDGLMKFPDGKEYFAAISQLNNYEEDAVIKWTERVGVKTIFSVVEGLDTGTVSYEDLEPIEQLAVQFHPVTKDPLLSENIMWMSHKVRSSDGLVIVGDQIGFANSDIQVWAPISQATALRQAARTGSFSNNPSFQILVDYRENQSSAVTARGTDFVDAPDLPWAANNEFSERHTNVNDDENRRCRSQWRHEQEVAPVGGLWQAGQAMSLSGYSYKRSLGYKTNHSFLYFFDWTRTDGNNVTPELNVSDSRRRTKRFTDTQLYHTATVGRAWLPLFSTEIVWLGGDIAFQSTFHTHRGMGGEWNILR